MDEKPYYVYIMTNKSGTLYVGVTNDIVRRVFEHRSGTGSAFTCRYKITQLIFVETCASILDAIAREKQIRGWTRAKKLALISEANPNLDDLSVIF